MIGSPNRATSWLTWAQQPREAGGLGLAPHQAAGIVGNLVHESGQDLSPWGPTGDNGTAWGTAQWRGDRLARLKARPDYQTVEGQQAFMREELDGSENKAYRALQAAKTPEEAAHAWDALYERSDGSTRAQRMSSARQLMEQFGGGAPSSEDAPGALSSAYAPTEKTSMPALSADSMLGPGALNPEASSKGLLGLNVSDNTYDGLMGMASSLAGISNPDQAKALIAQQAANKKVASDAGTWSIHTFPNGQSVLLNNKGRMMPLQGNYSAPEKDPREQEAAKLEMKRANDRYDSITTADRNVDEQMQKLDKFEAAVKNPNIYFGPGADQVVAAKQLASSMGVDVKGLTDAQIIQRMATEAQLAKGKLLPGAISNYEDQLMGRANGVGLDKSKEANLDAIATQRAILKHQKAVAEQAREYAKTNKYGVLDDGWESHISDWNAKNGVQIPQLPQQTAPAASPKANTFKTKSGVSWSIN